MEVQVSKELIVENESGTRAEIAVLKTALLKMDRALSLSNPEGATGEVFELWNDARRLAGLFYLKKVNAQVHDSDCALNRAPAYPVGECDCRLSEISQWKAAYESVCDERDAIAKDSDSAYHMLRKALMTLEVIVTETR